MPTYEAVDPISNVSASSDFHTLSRTQLTGQMFAASASHSSSVVSLRSYQCPPDSCRNPLESSHSGGIKFGRKAC